MNKEWGQGKTEAVIQGSAAPEIKAKNAKEKTKSPLGFWLRAIALAVLLLLAGALLWAGSFQGLVEKLGLGINPQRTGLQGLLEGGRSLLGTASTPTPQPQDLGAQRTLREIAYEEDRASLSALSQNPEVTEKTREDAAAQLVLMIASHQSELGIEEALKAAGFDPCLVLLQSGALTVMVRAPSLTNAQSATILSLCAAHTQLGVENIRIMTGS